MLGTGKCRDSENGRVRPWGVLLEPIIRIRLYRIGNVGVIEGNVCLVFLGRGMLLKVSRGCIEVDMVIREYVEDLEIREDEFDERCCIAVEAEVVVVDVDVVERGIDL